MSGRLICAGSASPPGVIDIFWWYEQWIRRREAHVHSVIGVTGAIYAMRRKLWQALPAGTLCDDMLVPMKLVLDGHRVGFCDNAMAFDNRKFSPKEEFRRKVRTQTGNLQLCLFESRLLDPRVNPTWLQFVCHKLIRIATPILLMLALPGIAICIWRLIDRWTGLPLLIVAAALTTAFTVLALATRGRVLRQTQVFFLLLAAPLVAIYFAARGKWNVW
jgi:cellulose synthase/poly-beta-1,6-N-acetylglucosamine synthase-like glycosyltransferase